MPPQWFEILASIALGVALLCCAYLMVTVIQRPRRMGVMNWVRPTTPSTSAPWRSWPLMHSAIRATPLHGLRDSSRSTNTTVGSGIAGGGAPSVRPRSLPSPVVARRQSEAERADDGACAPSQATSHQLKPHSNTAPPFWQTVFMGVTHCGLRLYPGGSHRRVDNLHPGHNHSSD